jgi:hypothetical protein
MAKIRASVTAIVITSVLAAAATGCAGDEKTAASSTAPSTSAASSTSSSATSSTSAAAAPVEGYAPAGDYTGLLLKPSDIGPGFTAADPPQPDPEGPGKTAISQTYNSSDTNRGVLISLTFFSDPARAAQHVADMKPGAPNSATDVPTQPIDVGTNGIMRAGVTTDTPPLAKTVVVFAENNVQVFLGFFSAPSDPTPSDFALALARKQDTAVKNGLPR